LVLLTDRSHHEGFSSEACGKVEVVPFVSTKHPLAKKRVLTPHELVDAPILVCSQVRAMVSRVKRVLQGMANKKIELNDVMYPANHRMLRRTLEAGWESGLRTAANLLDGKFGLHATAPTL
jgi:hypothetical protein